MKTTSPASPARNARCCAAIRGSSNRRSPRAAATRARRCASSPHDGQFLAWAAFSPHSQDPRPRLELRREPAHRRGVLRRRGSARRSRARAAVRSAERRRAPGPRRGRRPAGPDRRPLRRHAGGAVPVGAGVERWKAVLADALLAATGLRELYERSDASGREREGLKPLTGWLRGERRRPSIDHPRARLAARRSTSRPATRPASTSTSATAASASPSWRAAPASGACSTASATPAASRWPRWPG